MAVGDGARRHILDGAGLRRGGTRDAERHDPAAIEKQHPANRTAEEQLAFAILEQRVPAHRLWKREAAEDAAKDVGQDVDRCLAALLLAKCDVLALRRFHALERGHVYALLRGEAGGRGRRRAVRLKLADTGGPFSTSSKSVWRSDTRTTRTVRRRGVL
jgi:hypothetical protein